MTRETEQRDELLTDLGDVVAETKGQGGVRLLDGDTQMYYNISGLIED